MEKLFYIGPTYLRIDYVFDCSEQIKSPGLWQDEGEVIVWGYRISGSEVYFHSQLDYLSPAQLEFLPMCQYVCDRMTDLLDCCIQKIKSYNINPAHSGLRIYYSCESLSQQENEDLFKKLNQLSKKGRLKQITSKGRLSEKVTQIGEIDFYLGANSKTLINKMRDEKIRFVREITHYNLRTYQDYLDFKQRRSNNLNQLDELDI